MFAVEIVGRTEAGGVDSTGRRTGGVGDAGVRAKFVKHVKGWLREIERSGGILRRRGREGLFWWRDK